MVTAPARESGESIMRSRSNATAFRPLLPALSSLRLHGCFLFAIAASLAVYPANSQTLPSAGTLRMEKVYEDTPLNQPPDANLRMKQNQKHFRQQDFDVANAARQRQITDETAKLLILARDFKSRMDKLGSEPLPPELIREAEVIEILARDVQTKVILIVGAG
jgi:hypothetical protein